MHYDIYLLEMFQGCEYFQNVRYYQADNVYITTHDNTFGSWGIIKQDNTLWIYLRDVSSMAIP